MKRLILILFLIFIFSSCYTVGNLGYVGNGVWRSAQRWWLYEVWDKLELRTIINVASSPNDDQDEYERDWCKARGITYIAFDNVGPEYRFKEVLNALIKCEKPCLIHCEGGLDRTGGVIAVYKREILRKTLTDIINDWNVHGIPGENWLHFLFERLE